MVHPIVFGKYYIMFTLHRALSLMLYKYLLNLHKYLIISYTDKETDS